jgi:predicted small lipoprotein YifL
VIRSPHQMLLRIAAIGALAAALGLAGCGRKSGLDAPPSAAIEQPAGPAPAIGPDGKPVAPQGLNRRTPLDWLID